MVRIYLELKVAFIETFPRKLEPILNRHLIDDRHESQSLVFAPFYWGLIAAI
jgi:hypothetical protein